MQLAKHRKFTQSINFPIVLRVVGWLLMIESLFMVAPLVVALIYGEMWIVVDFAIAIGITLVAGMMMNHFSDRGECACLALREGSRPGAQPVHRRLSQFRDE